MSRVHMQDQKLRGNSGMGVWMIVALMFSVGFVSMLARSARADTAQCSVTGVTEDKLVGDEMSEYIARYPGDYEEYDME